MLTFPPHTSHKLQPLDRSIYDPLKQYYNANCDSWVVGNTRPMTIFDIAQIVSQPSNQAFTPANSKSGFAVTDIQPFNPDIFTDDEFLAATVTDQQHPLANSASTISSERPSTSAERCGPIENSASTVSSERSSTSAERCGPISMDHMYGTRTMAKDRMLMGTPEQLKPLPKAGPTKAGRGGRKQQTTRILTDNPIRAQAVSFLKKVITEKHSNSKPVEAIMKKKKLKTNDSTSKESDADLPSDDSDDNISDNDPENRPVNRKPEDKTSAAEHCVICGKFGKGNDLWFRCTMCAYWVHNACSGVDKAKGYICDCCK
jgi:hypothetical protein